MTSGRIPHLVPEVILLLGTLLAAPLGCATETAAAPAPRTLEQLMQALSLVETSSARFVERKYLGVLSEPLTYGGVLRYEAPDFLAKTFDSHDMESYEVRADQLRILETNGTHRDIALETQPLIGAFIDAFRATLAGDQTSLEASYHVSFETPGDGWRLALEPKLPALAEYLEAVIIEGRQATIHTIELRERNGDRSVTTLDTPGG